MTSKVVELPLTSSTSVPSSSSSSALPSFPTWEDLRKANPAVDEFLRQQEKAKEKEIDTSLLEAKRAFATSYPRLRAMVEEKIPIGVCGTCFVEEQPTRQWLRAKKYVENLVFLLCSSARFEKEIPKKNQEFHATDIESLIAAATDHIVACVTNDKTTQNMVRWLKENQTESEKVYECKLELLERVDVAKVIPALYCVHWQWRDIFEDLILICLYEIVNLA